MKSTKNLRWSQVFCYLDSSIFVISLSIVFIKVSGIVTVEDHSVIGGLGSAVSEYLSESNPTKVIKIGVQDRFGESGESEELLDLVGLNVQSIESAARSLLKF